MAEAVEEIMKTYKALPIRPEIEEVEAAISVVKTVNAEQQARNDEISSQVSPPGVSPELFSVLKQLRKTMVLYQSHEQMKEALQLVELYKMFQTFDELIQRAYELVAGEGERDSSSNPGGELGREALIEQSDFQEHKIDDGLKLQRLVRSSSAKAEADGLLTSSSINAAMLRPGGGNAEKLSLVQVAAMIETSARNSVKILDLKGKLMEKIEWLPESLGKLTNIHELNLSENRITDLPSAIVSLIALMKLDAHSNKLTSIPDSFGDLVNLTHLDFHANTLHALPSSFTNLTNLIDLDLSSNHLTKLPDQIGKLTSLKRLNTETNEIEEIPYTIGSCLALAELRLDFNKIKALPEAIGKLESLEVLTLHYNRIRGLPTTMGNLANLREFDVSFNELESVPESLCLATSLVKLNVGKNFADLRALPRSIGNLEMLEELDISDDQIRVLPDSFRFLSKLKVFRADETPLEVPPRQVVRLGAQGVVEYMADLVARRNLKLQQPNKKKDLSSRVCTLFWN